MDLQQDQDGRRMKTRPPKSPQARAMRSRKSVVAIIVEKGNDGVWLGSGCIIRGGPGGSLVLTCEHVLRNATSIRIRRVLRRGGVKEYPATIIRAHLPTDIAFLSVPNLTKASLALKLVEAPGNVQLNQAAVAIGYASPADGPESVWDGSFLVRLPSISPGCICECDELLDWRVAEEPGKRKLGRMEGIVNEVVFLNCETIGGMSGGPVVDSRGVIGMNIKVSDTGNPVMMVVSSKSIIQLLKVAAGLHINERITMEELLSRLAP